MLTGTTLHWIAANSFAGATVIEAGTLQLGNSLALGSNTSVSSLATGTLDLNGNAIGSAVPLDDFAGTLTNSDTGVAASFGATINATTQDSFTVSGSGDITLGAAVYGSSTVTLTKSGGNTLTIADASEYDGLSVNIDDGNVVQGGSATYTSLDIGAGSTMTIAPSGPGIAVTTTLDWDPGQTGPTTGIASGGSGTWDTMSHDWYNPVTNADQAWSSADTAMFAGSTGAVTLDSGISAGGVSFQTDGYTLQDGSLTIGDFGVNVAAGAHATVDSTLDGSTGLFKVGTGNLTIGGTNSYSGETWIHDGTLTLASSGALGETSDVTASTGGTFDLNGQSIDDAVPLQLFEGTLANSDSTTAATFAGVVNYGPLGIAPGFIVSGAGDITLGGAVDEYGFGTLTKTGTNTLILSGSDDNIGLNLVVDDGTVELDKSSSSSVHAVEDALTINGGTVQFSGTGSDQIEDGAPVTIDGGTLDLNGESETIGSLSGSGGTITNAYSGSTAILTVNLASGTATTFAGNIDDDGTGHVGVTFSGSGTLTLDNVSYSGNTTIESGAILLFASPDPALGGTITIAYGATLQLQNPNSLGNCSGLAGDGTLDLNFQTFGIPVAVGTFNGTVINPEAELVPAGADGSPAPQPAAENTGAMSESGARYFDGMVDIVGAALDPDASSFWTQQPVWTNNPLLLTRASGENVGTTFQPQLFQVDATHVVITDGNSASWFSNTAGEHSYTELYASGSTLTYDATTDIFTFSDSTGDTETFYGFSTTRPTTEYGQLVGYSNTGGAAYAYDYSSGLVSTVTLTQDSSFVRKAVYTYYGSSGTGDNTYGNAGELQSVKIEDADGHTLDETYYRYYTPSNDTDGYVGGLEYMFSLPSVDSLQSAYSGSDLYTLSSADVDHYADVALQYNSAHEVTQVISQGLGCSVCDAGLGTYSYSYAESSSGIATPGFNTYAYETTETLPDGSANIVFSNYEGETILTVHADSVTDAQPGADAQQWMTYYNYDSNGRLIEEAQPSAITGYSVSSGVLSVSLSADSGLIENTDYYSSTISPNDSTTLDSGDGIDSNIGQVSGYVEDYTVQQGTSGTPVLQEAFQYYLDTPAGSDGALVAPVATDTVYADSTGDLPYYYNSAGVQHDTGNDSQNPFDGSGSPETTTYSYTFFSDDGQMASTTVTTPGVTDQAGSGGASTTDSTTTVYNESGQVIWTKDAAGYLSYTQYDPATGAVTETIQDVNTSTGIVSGSLEATSLPSGWSMPTGSGLNLVTTYAVDGLGRTIQETDPDGNVTFTVYDDADHEVRVYSGFHWDASADEGAGAYVQMSNPPPTQVEIDDLPVPADLETDGYVGTYSETFTMSATPDLASNGAPTGGEAISNVKSLSISIMNQAGQVVESDDYYILPDLTSDVSESGMVLSALKAGAKWTPGTAYADANFYVTTYAYADNGELDRVEDPNGTITRTVYDTLNRVVSTWVGTDDAPYTSGGTTTYWTPGGTADSDWNMIETSSDVYDDGGVGDSNLTQSTQFVFAVPTTWPTTAADLPSETQDATQMYYNWQDELVATKSGVSLNDNGSENLTGELSDGVNRPLVVYTLDNLGETVEEQTYAGDGVAVSTTSGSLSLTAPTGVTLSTLLRAESTIEYDTQGRVSETDEYSVTQSGDDAGTVGDVPLTTDIYYDPRGLVAETDVYDVDLSGDALNTQTTDYTYNGAGWQTSVVVPDPETDDGSATPGYLTTSYSYDADGNVLTATDPMGNVTTYVYDDADRLTEVYLPNPDGGAGPSSFSGLSSTNPETIYTYDAAGNLYTVEEPNGTTTTYLYDALGREIETEQTDPITNGSDGNANTSDYSVLVTKDTYDGDSNVLTATDAEGNVTTYQYDILGDQTAVILPEITVTNTSGGSPGETHPKTDSTYDSLGDLLSTTDANGRETTYAYNALGEQTLETDPSPGTDDPTLETATLEAAATITTTYDTLGGVLSQVDTLGDTTDYTYDGFHNLATVANPGVSGDTTSYSYDALGNLLGETDGDGNTTSYAYDSLNRLTSQSEEVALSYSDGTETDGTATTSYAYDADGDLTKTTDPDGHIITDTYDNLIRETEENWYADSTALADSDPSETINYGYNLAGEVTSAYDDSSGYSYSYDTLGRLTQIDNLGGETHGTPDVPDVQLNIVYDADGNESSLSATIGGTADFLDTYSYNAAQWLTSITQQGQDGGDTVGGEHVTFNYDASGDNTGESLYQSTDTSALVAKETSAYDGAGRLTSMTYANADGSIVYDSFAYTYDSADRVYSFADAQHADESTAYSYDTASELTGAAPTGTDEAENTANYYANSYDPNGNAATVDGGSTVTGLGNRLLSDGTWEYAYDLNGNLISKTGVSDGSAAGQVVEYSYDAMNRLTGVGYYTDSVETQAVGYTYDMYGDLIGRSVTTYTGDSSSTTSAQFVYDNNGNMSLAFVGGTLADRYLQGPAIDQILADQQISTGNTWWAATDDQGTVKDLLQYDTGTDTTSVASHLAYSPFGDLDTTDSSGLDIATVDFLFGDSGAWTDPITGLQWHNDPSSGSFGRWYDPETQQWIGQDPTGLTFGPNPYEDVDNSPTNLIDPSGLAPQGSDSFSDIENLATLIGVAGVPGVCPRDNIPASFNPGSALPTLPVGTMTEESRRENQLYIDQQTARRIAFIKNGGQIHSEAYNGEPAWVAGLAGFGEGLEDGAGNLANGVKSIFNGDAGRSIGNRAVAIVENQTGQAFTGSASQWQSVGWQMGMEMTGVNGMAEGVSGYDMTNNQQLSGSDRTARFAGGLSSFAGWASMGVGVASKFFPKAIPMPPPGPISHALASAIPAPVRDFLNTDLGDLVRGGTSERPVLPGQTCPEGQITCFVAGTQVLVVRPEGDHAAVDGNAPGAADTSTRDAFLAVGMLMVGAIPLAAGRRGRQIRNGSLALCSTDDGRDGRDEDRIPEPVKPASDPRDYFAAASGARNGVACAVGCEVLPVPRGDGHGSRVARQRSPRKSEWQRAWLGVCLLFAALLAGRASSHRAEAPAPAHGTAARSQASQPIETIRVGQRVVSSPNGSSADQRTSVDPRTWRRLRIEADNRWSDATPDVIHVETLQPPEWIESNHAQVGAMVHLPIDLTEMGIPASIQGRVVANEPCPDIKAGPGRVVLATINHLNNDVRELDVADQAGRSETVRPTGFHRFYSATRRTWVSAGGLQLGEELEGAAGPVFVRGLRKLPGAQLVYNMSVEEEHVYRVSALGVLVHNAGCSPLGRGSTGRIAPTDLKEQLAMQQAMSSPTAGR